MVGHFAASYLPTRNPALFDDHNRYYVVNSYDYHTSHIIIIMITNMRTNRQYTTIHITIPKHIAETYDPTLELKTATEMTSRCPKEPGSWAGALLL